MNAGRDGRDYPDLPPATRTPCNDCPWRRVAAPGWLGPYDPQHWIELAHSEQPIACHQTIKVEDWSDPELRQCKGAAIFRSNVFKLPRNPQDAAATTKVDTVKVFATDTEFIDYHEPKYRELYEPARKR